MKLASRLIQPPCALPLGGEGTVVGRQWLACGKGSPDSPGHCTSVFTTFSTPGFPYDHVIDNSVSPRPLKSTCGSSVPGSEVRLAVLLWPLKSPPS